MAENFIYDLDEDEQFLTEAEIAMRNRFAREYVIDYDAFKACLRIGFTKPAALKWATTLLNEGYTNRKIKELELKKGEESDSQKQEDVGIVMSVLREAAQNGPFNTRVSAAATLAKILGMDKEAKTDDEIKGGVLMIPEIADVTQWEIIATESQKQLVKESINEL